jgi:hypothetical protein
LLLVLLENSKRIRELEGRLLHLQVEDALVGVVVVKRVNGVDSG